MDSTKAKGARTIGEFVEWAGISRTATFAAIKDGRLVARKAGRRTLITHEDGEKFLRSLPMRKAS